MPPTQLAQQNLKPVLEQVHAAIGGLAKPAPPDRIGRLVQPSVPLSSVKTAILHLANQAQAQAFKWPADTRSGQRKTRYWHTAFEVFCDAQLLSITAKKALTRAELTTRLKTRLFGCALSRIQRQLRMALGDLTARKQLFAQPPVGRQRAIRYGQQIPDPTPYLQPTISAFNKMQTAWHKAGLPRQLLVESVIQALTGKDAPPEIPETRRPLPAGPEATALILETIPTIEPAAHQQVLVSIPHLRNALGLPKDEFDQAIMDLAGAGQLWLHQHIDPSQLSDREKNTLVSLDNETFYMGLVLRSPHD